MSAAAPKATAGSPLEVVRRWYASRDPELLAEDVGWSVAPGFPEGGDLAGRRAVLEGFLPGLLARFAEFGAHPIEMLPAADGRVVVTGEYRGTAKASGAGFASRFVHVWTVRGGRIASFWQVADTAPVQAALEAHGAGSRA